MLDIELANSDSITRAKTSNQIKPSKPKYTQKQKLTLCMFAFVNVWSASCVSIQAPFFPKEVEKKGGSNTESGLVFGCFQLTVLVMSPIFGKYMNRIGPKLLFNAGVVITGLCSIVFGFLTLVPSREGFIAFAFCIRIVEAIGYTAAITSTFTLIAAEFPHSLATVFASMETFNGFGLIIGPMIGVWLYQIGGFTTPFACIGCLLLLGGLFAYFVMPEVPKDSNGADSKESNGFLKIIRIPSVAMAAFSIFGAAVSIGFNFPTLEPHVRSLNLDGFVYGLVFYMHGITYAASAPIWGILCDKFMRAKDVTLVGAVLIGIGVGLIGPVHFLPLPKTVGIILTGLCIQGLGLGAVLVSGFAGCLQAALESGFPDGITTKGLVSGLWMTVFAFGNFIGPVIGGALLDYFEEYSKACIAVLIIQLLVIMVYCSKLTLDAFRKRKAKPQKTHLSIINGSTNEGFELNHSN